MNRNSQKSCRFFCIVHDLVNANYSIRIKKYRCANVLVIDKPFCGEIYAFQKQPLASFPTSVSNSSLAFEFSRGPINPGLKVLDGNFLLLFYIHILGLVNGQSYEWQAKVLLICRLIYAFLGIH